MSRKTQPHRGWKKTGIKVNPSDWSGTSRRPLPLGEAGWHPPSTRVTLLGTMDKHQESLKGSRLLTQLLQLCELTLRESGVRYEKTFISVLFTVVKVCEACPVQRQTVSLVNSALVLRRHVK